MTVERFPIEEGHILLFSRAIGDPNRVYSDPTYAATTEVEGIIAPPTFVQASAQFDPDNPLRPKIGEVWFGSGRNPTGRQPAGQGEGGGGGGTGLHAEQEYEYHRPLRPGDVLSSTTHPGERWEKQGRSGKLVFSESVTEYRDQNGDLVVTARSVGVRTERPVPAGGTLMVLHAKELSVGDHRELVLVDDLTRTQIVQYAGASGDYNPLHSDEVFATQVAGYPTIFAHGMLTMGMTGRVLTDWVGDGRLLRYRARFVKQVWPGDELTAHAEVTAIREADGVPVADFDVVTTNQAGDTVLSGNATARLDP